MSSSSVDGYSDSDQTALGDDSVLMQDEEHSVVGEEASGRPLNMGLYNELMPYTVPQVEMVNFLDTIVAQLALHVSQASFAPGALTWTRQMHR